ncbi:MAG TPA: hypothetical protein VL175_10725 [Pirellulales bacterium]|jgi:hypothetical protein|nr:hypothetical protein [Pirellulales bacterium]
MRIAVVGASLVASLVFALVLTSIAPAVGLAQRGEPGRSGNGLIALTVPSGEHRQQVTVIDPDLRVVGVYHIDLATGEIVLKSVRNIHWDLQLGVFNGTSPLPREVQALLEQK